MYFLPNVAKVLALSPTFVEPYEVIFNAAVYYKLVVILVILV